MKYNDVFREHEPHLDGEFITNDQCLVWTANYEHAVFDIKDEIHPAAVYVWLQTGLTHVPCRLISKFQLMYGIWKRVEKCDGTLPFVNNNPFDPCKDNASNTAKSVFLQNIKDVAKPIESEEKMLGLKFIYSVITQEVEHQIEKWGYQHHSNGVWFLILLEEIGEVADAILKKEADQTRAELIQCAAVIISWLRNNRSNPAELNISEWFLIVVKKIGEGAKDILEGKANDR